MRCLVPDPMAVRGMLSRCEQMSAATEVTVDETQEVDAVDLLAVCSKMSPRGQLKGRGEERQRYSVYVEGSHSGAQWGADAIPFQSKPRVLQAIDIWRRRIGTIEATHTYRCGKSLCKFVRSRVPEVISELVTLKETDTTVTVVRYSGYAKEGPGTDFVNTELFAHVMEELW